MRTAFVSSHQHLPQGKEPCTKKSESKISFQDVQDCLVLVSTSFSTRTCYENQTKKAITNKFVQEAMTEFLKHQLEVYFIENPESRRKDLRAGAHQQAQPRARGKNAPEHQEEALRQIDMANRVQKFVDCRTKDPPAASCISWRATPLWARSSSRRDAEFRPSCPSAARS